MANIIIETPINLKSSRVHEFESLLQDIVGFFEVEHTIMVTTNHFRYPSDVSIYGYNAKPLARSITCGRQWPAKSWTMFPVGLGKPMPKEPSLKSRLGLRPLCRSSRFKAQCALADYFRAMATMSENSASFWKHCRPFEHCYRAHIPGYQ